MLCTTLLSMHWGLKRKMIYTLAVLAFIGGIIFLILRSYLSVDPTCFDAKLNGDESGIDCGGSCELVCRDDTRDIIIEWARALPVTDTVYNLVASLQNQNVHAGIRRVAYEFKAYDSKNILIAERRGYTAIGPNQRTAIFEGTVDMGIRVPYLTTFTFLEPLVWHETEDRFAKKLLTIERETWTQLESSPKLTARVRNNNAFDIVDVNVVVIAYDGSGNALATSQTVVESIPQGSFKDVAFTWPQPLQATPIKVDIIPRINAFAQ